MLLALAGAGYLRGLQTTRPTLWIALGANALNLVAEVVLGAENVRCATYCGEFSGGFGYSINWVEPTADLYVSRTPTARDYAVKLGMPRERTRVRGHMMQPRAYVEVLHGERPVDGEPGGVTGGAP